MSIRNHRAKRSRPLAYDPLEERLVLSSPDLAPSLGAPPPPSANVFWVNTEAAIQNAVNNLQSGQTIVIQKGTYNLSNTLYIGKARPVTNVTIRGETDNFNDVVLLGKGMDNASFGNVPMGISVYNAQNVAIADLSIGQVYYHPIELVGPSGASQVQVYHTRLFDAGEQFLKADPNASGGGVNNSSVKDSLIEYTAGTPTTDHGGGVGYTNGIDVHAGQNWDIADNLVRNLHVPDSAGANLWNPAILIWNHSSNVTVERNTIIDCDRAIAMGLTLQSSGYDNQDGIVRNNMISMRAGLFSATRASSADAAILAWDSPGTKIDFNTVLTNGNAPNSIQTRWTTTGVQILDNLSDASPRARDNSTFNQGGDYWGATAGMFVNPSAGDLHLLSNAATQASVIDKVAPLADVPDDWDGAARPSGNNADVGADEHASSTAAAPTVTGTSPSPGSAGAAAGATASATFSASVQASSIVFTLKDGSGNAVAGSLTYNDSTRTATLTPSSPLSPSVTYTATVSGAKDGSGNAMTSAYVWSFTTAAAPTVTGESPAPGSTGVSATTAVAATFSQSMQASSIAFSLKDGTGASVPASLTYNDSTRTATLTPSSPLAASMTYTATVGSGTSAAGFALGAPTTWSFTTASAAGGTWTQTTAADFGVGTSSGTVVTNNSGGEIQLAPKFSDDFGGVALGSSWTTVSYGSGPRFTVSGGTLSVSGGAVYSEATYSGMPVEARLNIRAAQYQHFGLAIGLASVAGNSWAIFSTMGTTNTLYARVNSNGATTDVKIGALPTGYHVYQVKPTSGGYQFLIDRVPVTTVSRATPPGTPMKIAISSLNASTATAVAADWVRVDSYPSSGTFLSTTLDAGRMATWGPITWTASLPAGTSLVVSTESSTDGINWSSWTPVSNGGTVSSPAGRYLRYRVTLATTDPTATAVFSDITINWA